MAVLKKANFQSVGISRLIKKSIMLKDQEKKLIQTSIFSKLPSLSWGFKKKARSTYYRILFTPKNII